MWQIQNQRDVVMVNDILAPFIYQESRKGPRLSTASLITEAIGPEELIISDKTHTLPARFSTFLVQQVEFH